MKTYKWFRSGNLAEVQRCKELFHKSDTGHLTNVNYLIRRRFLEDGETETEPGYYGFPIGMGSEGAGNQGAILFQTVRDAIDNGTTTGLTAEELLEMQAFCALEEDIEAAWNWSLDCAEYYVGGYVPPGNGE